MTRAVNILLVSAIVRLIFHLFLKHLTVEISENLSFSAVFPREALERSSEQRRLAG